MTFYIDSIRTALNELGDGRELDDGVKNLLDKVNSQVWDAVHATKPEYDYEVSLTCNFEGKTPEEAVQKFIDWMGEAPYDWVYGVKNLDQDYEEYLVDGSTVLNKQEY